MASEQSGQILVAYTTMYGSTREVADTIAEEIRMRGFAVEVQQAREVRSLEGYAAVVLGTALECLIPFAAEKQGYSYATVRIPGIGR